MNKVNSNDNNSKPNICNSDMTFEDCELAILRQAVDENRKMQGQKMANSEEIQKIIKILEDFLIKKQCICYGGTAINNILPSDAQFYDRSIETPDYDFYSIDPMNDAKELADIYYNAGYIDVEAKSGVHYGTFKVFVNFIPIADITQLHKQIFESILKDSITISGILYAPPNFLRLSMFLELSRPHGDVSRWEKVLNRLTLLNKYYPLKPKNNCNIIDFQRKMETNQDKSTKIYYIIRDSFINQGVVFFGGYATSLYSKYMLKSEKEIVKTIPDFDVLAEDPDRTANIIIEQLKQNGINNISQINHEKIGELIPRHIEIRIGKDTIAFIYAPIACHNYNTIMVKDKEIKVASIDTILSFYLAFYYSDDPYPNKFKERMLCIAEFLFKIEEKNRLNQIGLLKRFNMDCYGKQLTIEQIRAEKVKKFQELKNNRNSEEYNMWFLKYNPNNKNNSENIKSKPHKYKKIRVKNQSNTNKLKPNKIKTYKLNKTNKKKRLPFFTLY